MPHPSAVADPFDLCRHTVAAALAVSPAALRAKTRKSAPAAFARQCAMYLAHVAFGCSFTEIGRMFGRDRTTAAHACRLIEDRRDEPWLDNLLNSLEAACRRHALAAGQKVRL